MFDNAFAGIGYEQAIALLLGDQKMTPMQESILALASSDPKTNTFIPLPVDHIGFQTRATDGNNHSDPLVLVPGSQLVRRRINQLRRSDLAATLNVDQNTADILFTEVNGWQPAIDYVVALFNVFKSNPKITDNELKYSHDIKFWNSQKRAIRALRHYFNKVMLPA